MPKLRPVAGLSPTLATTRLPVVSVALPINNFTQWNPLTLRYGMVFIFSSIIVEHNEFHTVSPPACWDPFHLLVVRLCCAGSLWRGILLSELGKWLLLLWDLFCRDVWGTHSQMHSSISITSFVTLRLAPASFSLPLLPFAQWLHRRARFNFHVRDFPRCASVIHR